MIRIITLVALIVIAVVSSIGISYNREHYDFKENCESLNGIWLQFRPYKCLAIEGGRIEEIPIDELRFNTKIIGET